MTRSLVEDVEHIYVTTLHLQKALATIALALGLMFGAGTVNAQLPNTCVQLNRKDTALVVIDPQNDVLSEKGVSWELLGDSVTENHTIENIERLFKAAKEQGFAVFLSPHYLYPTDQAWQFGGAVEKMMLEDKEFGALIHLVWTVFLAPGPTGSSATSPSSRTARRSWPTRTRCTVCKVTTSSCSSASAASIRSSWRG